jgi:uncharacterized RDD family membrane protein YckC
LVAAAPGKEFAQPDFPAFSKGEGMASTDVGESASRAQSGARAGFWIRFGGAFIDGVLLGIVSGVLRVALKGGAGAAIAAAVEILYFTLLVGGRGQTLGMSAVGIRVVDQDGGGNIGYARAGARWLVSVFSFLCILLGYLWMLWDGEKQCWHDKAARDVVVPA